MKSQETALTMITVLQLTTDFLFNNSASLVLFVAAIIALSRD